MNNNYHKIKECIEQNSNVYFRPINPVVIDAEQFNSLKHNKIYKTTPIAIQHVLEKNIFSKKRHILRQEKFINNKTRKISY